MTKNSQLNEETLSRIITDEGLLHCKNIKVIRDYLSSSSISLKLVQNASIAIFPHPDIAGVLYFLIEKPSIWQQASLAVRTERWGQKRAPIFGVPFDMALKKAAKEGTHKAVFSIQNPNEFSGQGGTADLCMFIRHVVRNKKEIFEFQSWQFLRPDLETFYIHGEIDLLTNLFIHIDGAKIDLSEENISTILYLKERPKGPKIKLFRIDGNIEYIDAISIIKVFFPIEELNNEAYICSSIQ